MFLIVGLGNPGHQYEDTRHNIGFMLVDEIAQECRATFTPDRYKSLSVKTVWNGFNVLLSKPQTYMNLSGNSVLPFLSFYKLPISNVIAVFDDLDLPFANVKTRFGGGSGGHNGIKSITEKTGSDKYHRVKIGIGKPPIREMTASWVLHKFNQEEIQKLYAESFPLAKERILAIMAHQLKTGGAKDTL